MATTDDIAWTLRTLNNDRNLYEKRRRYYDGDHDLTFATEKFKNSFGHLFQAMADNLCGTVVDVTADRLRIKGFDGGAASEIQKMFEQRYSRRVMGDVHSDTLKLGDTYVLVWPEVAQDGTNGPVRFWLNDPTTMVVKYDPNQLGVIEFAGKLWAAPNSGGKKVWRMNLYYPDRIEKFIAERSSTSVPQNSSGFAPFISDTAETNFEEHELERVPVVHFANNAPIGRRGRSELDKVIPLQDALNKSLADMLVAMEFAAYHQRYATGITMAPKYDPLTGEPETDTVSKAPFEPGQERLWLGGPGVEFGEFQTADLRQFIEVQNSLRAEIARVSDTPVHDLMHSDGELPSGEALKVGESRLVAKCDDRSESLGDSWHDAYGLRLALENGRRYEDLDLKINWASFATRDAKQEVEIALLKKQIGVSNSQNQRELGYDADAIETMRQESEVDAQAAADAMGAFINRGASTPVPIGGE